MRCEPHGGLRHRSHPDCALSHQERLVDMITFAARHIEGLSVFYREAGDPHNPTIVLLGGFPSSSHMFRGLMPLLEKQFHNGKHFCEPSSPRRSSSRGKEISSLPRKEAPPIYGT